MSIAEISLVDREAPAASPFLPGTSIQYAWDSTSLGYLKTCPRLYQLTMLEGWSPQDESIHLRFGIEYHKALEDYDRLRADEADHEEALRTTLRELLTRTYGWEVDEDTKAGKYKNRRSLVRTVSWYLEEFQHDNAKTYILSNGSPAVELSFRFELDWGPKSGSQLTYTDTGKPFEVDLSPGGISAVNPATGNGMDVALVEQPYLLSGHLDRVVNFAGSLFVMDRKTTTTTPSQYYFNQFEPNNQMTLYTLASQVILSSPIKGVIIDAAQILIDSNRFVRGTTYRTPDQLQEWTDDLRYWLSMAEGFAENGHWPMNDTACDKFGGCRFREVCSSSPQVRDARLRAKFTKLEEADRWNPLKPR